MGNSRSETGGSGEYGENVDVRSDLSLAVTQYLESLRELGITVVPAVGRIEFDFECGRMLVGHLTIAQPGEVEVVPRLGVTLSQLSAMLQAAQLAVMCGPDPACGWRVVDGVGWSVGVFQRIPD